ncbi:3-ketoacyl-ACP reductase [Halobacteriales archaeon QS_4_66_20]|nr:MAG: 3-ketoacyl-ACP reductase [Halobacteriales archaeon QS_4_66_20]
MTELLTDRVCVVTGAASGIGRSIALAFADHGAAVVVADIRREPREGGRPTYEVIQEDGGTARFVETDVSNPDDLERAVAVAAEEGALNVMVNNAGVLEWREFTEVTEAEYDRTMDVNAKGTFFGCQAAAKAMLDGDGGSIINLSSTAGIRGAAAYPSYCASKGAIRLLTYALADDLGPEGIRVNAIHPGAVESEMTRADSRVVDTEREDAFTEETPLGRLGQPEEVADAAVYLASELSSYVNGESLLVDGGISNT